MRIRSALVRACATALLCTLIGALTFALGAAELERGTRAEDVAAAQPARVVLVESLATRLAAAPRGSRTATDLRRDLLAASADLAAAQRRLVDPHGDLHLSRWPVSEASSALAATTLVVSLANHVAHAPTPAGAALVALHAEAVALASTDVRIDDVYLAALARLRSDVDAERLVAIAFVAGALSIEAVFVARPLRARFARRRRVAFARAPSLRR